MENSPASEKPPVPQRSSGMSALLIAVVGVVAVVVVIVGAFMFVKLTSQARPPASEIFAAILNAQNKQSATRLAAGAANPEDASISADLSILPYYEPNTFSSYDSTMEAGPAVGKCSGYFFYQGTDFVKTSSVNFVDDQGNYYSKYTSRDRENNLIDYSLSTPDATYDYRGGQFAVKTPGSLFRGFAEPAPLEATTGATDAGDSVIVDEPLPVDSETINREFTIQDYFGPDAQILGNEMIDGKDHYIATWSYDGYCGDSDQMAKIVSKVWVSVDDFRYARDENYLDTISPENLIVRNTSSSTERTATFSEVSSEFVFDVNVEVRDINPEDYAQGSDSYNSALRNKLLETGIDLLTPSGMTLSYYGASTLDLTDPYGYRYERAFYPAGAIGDTLFDQAQQDLQYLRDTVVSTFNFGFDSQTDNVYRSVSLDFYEEGLSDLSKIGLSADVSAKKVNMTVGGSTVSVNLLVNPFDYGVASSSSGSAGGGPAVDPEVKEDISIREECPDCLDTYVISFSRDGGTWVGWMHGYESESQVTSVSFAALSDVDAIVKALADVVLPTPEILY